MQSLAQGLPSKIPGERAARGGRDAGGAAAGAAAEAAGGSMTGESPEPEKMVRLSAIIFESPPVPLREQTPNFDNSLLKDK